MEIRRAEKPDLRYTSAMAVMSKTEISALSPEERMALIDALWESIDPHGEEDEAIPLWQREILDQRLLDLELSPGDELTRAEARGQLLL
jgi:putative addiction module component (TIGR02574 family)